MKGIISLALAFLMVCIFSSIKAESQAKDTLRIGSYNVRIDVDSDNRDWSKRKEHVADIIKNLYMFDIFGVQELRNITQENQLMSYLSDTYTSFSKGRDNTAGTVGERLAIIYRTDRFERLTTGFFFLSETPSVASKGWDAKLNRICLWAKMKDKITSQEFYFLCAHYDHVGTVARRESSTLIISKIREIMGNDDLPVAFAGDFNVEPSNVAYSTIIKGGLIDSRELPTNDNIVGPVGTFNQWNLNPSAVKKRIDYIFVNQKVEVYSYYTIIKKYFPDAYPSDHFPIMIKASINNLPSDLKPTMSSSGVKVSMHKNNEVHLKGDLPFTYTIYNATGSLIEAQHKFQYADVSISMKDQYKGIYFVKTNSDTGDSVTKILFQ